MTAQDSEPLNLQQRLEALRHIVHDDANGHKWGHVLRVLAQWPDDDTLTIGVDYIENTMLRDLPRRHVPWRWLAQLKDRPDDPRWRLFNAIEFSPRGIGPEHLKALSDADLCANLRSVQVSLNDAKHPALTTIIERIGPERVEHIKLTGQPTPAHGAQDALRVFQDARPHHLEVSHFQPWLDALLRTIDLSALRSLRLSDSPASPSTLNSTLRACAASLQTLHIRSCAKGVDLDISPESWAALTHLEELTLTHNRLEEMDALIDHLPGAALQRLDLDDNLLDGALLARMPRASWFENLTHLNVSRNPMADGACCLTLPRHLKALSLNDSGLDEAWCANVLASAALPPSLESLQLNKSALGAGLAQALDDALPTHTALTRLSLREAGLTLDHVEHLAQLAKLSGLQNLDLSRNNLGPQSAAALARAEHLSALHTLNISDNPGLGAEGLQHLLRAPFVPALRNLDLSQTGIDAQNVASLASCTRFESLVYLDINHNTLGPEGFSTLVGAPFLPTLEWLSVNHVGAGDAGMIALTQAPRRVALWWLSAEQNQLSSAAMRAMSDGDFLRDVEFLFFDGNDLGPEGIRALAQCPHTHSLIWASFELYDDEDPDAEQAMCDALLASPYMPLEILYGLVPPKEQAP